jgi:hypothetical protein
MAAIREDEEKKELENQEGNAIQEGNQREKQKKESIPKNNFIIKFKNFYYNFYYNFLPSFTCNLMYKIYTCNCKHC